MLNLRVLGTTLRKHSCIHKKSKDRLNSRNACNIALQNILPSVLLSNNLKIKINEMIIFLLFFMCVKLGLSH
jgi:hypothetical protein